MLHVVAGYARLRDIGPITFWTEDTLSVCDMVACIAHKKTARIAPSRFCLATRFCQVATTTAAQ